VPLSYQNDNIPFMAFLSEFLSIVAKHQTNIITLAFANSVI